MINYKALEISEASKGSFEGKVTSKTIDSLKQGHLLIKVEYSSLNYKDCLSISGNKGVTRNYPHIPGIDLAGEIIKSNSERFKIGDKVIATGYDLGMNHAGGFAEYVEVPEEWVVSLPDNLTTKQSMMFGTAGFTAMSGFLALKKHLSDLSTKKILVTGSTGGVGTISCLLLQESGCQIIASTRNTGSKYVSNLGIKNIINSNILSKPQQKPLLDKLYDGVIDNVGGIILENIIKSVSYHGMIISCGNVCGIEFSSTVFPFILRGITLKGISSANTLMKEREIIWKEISKFQNWDKLSKITEEITIGQIIEKSKLMLNGKHQGRFLIKFL